MREIEKDETNKETVYYLRVYDKDGDLITEVPLGKKIPKKFKRIKVRRFK